MYLVWRRRRGRGGADSLTHCLDVSGVEEKAGKRGSRPTDSLTHCLDVSGVEEKAGKRGSRLTDSLTHCLDVSGVEEKAGKRGKQQEARLLSHLMENYDRNTYKVIFLS